jgi:hypothetical protein
MEDPLIKIKNILKKPSKSIIYLPYQVTTYSEVIEQWKKYKKHRHIKIDEINSVWPVAQIFNFHFSKINHVLLYYSANLENCLLMCKINNKYINMIAPMEPLKDIGRNFVATYC